jgi:hypothetical protein
MLRFAKEARSGGQESDGLESRPAGVHSGGITKVLKSSLTPSFTLMNREFENAAVGLEKIVVQSLRLTPPADAPLLAWLVICGSAVAQRTRALNFKDGVLQVEVPDAGWKVELQSLAPRYLAMIQRYTTERVQKIEFVIAAPEKH